MKPENVPMWMAGTMIGKALLACKEILTSREEGDRMIILVSDGDSFDLSGGNDEAVAQTLRQNNITVYAIHISAGDIPGEIANDHRPDRRRGLPRGRPAVAPGGLPADRCHEARPGSRRRRRSYSTTSLPSAWPGWSSSG